MTGETISARFNSETVITTWQPSLLSAVFLPRQVQHYRCSSFSRVRRVRPSLPSSALPRFHPPSLPPSFLASLPPPCLASSRLLFVPPVHLPSLLVKHSLVAVSYIIHKVCIVPKLLEFTTPRSIFTVYKYKAVVTDTRPNSGRSRLLVMRHARTMAWQDFLEWLRFNGYSFVFGIVSIILGILYDTFTQLVWHRPCEPVLFYSTDKRLFPLFSIPVSPAIQPFPTYPLPLTPGPLYFISAVRSSRVQSQAADINYHSI